MEIEHTVTGVWERDQALRTCFQTEHRPDHVYADINTKSCLRHRQACVSGRPDVAVAGPPCQKLSQINPKRFADPNSNFDLDECFLGIVRYAKSYKPPWLVVEDVEGSDMTAAASGNATTTIDKLQSELKKRGVKYDWQQYLMCPTKLGVPMTRRRIYLVGMLEGHSGDLEKVNTIITNAFQLASERGMVPISDYLIGPDGEKAEQTRKSLKAVEETASGNYSCLGGGWGFARAQTNHANLRSGKKCFWLKFNESGFLAAGLSCAESFPACRLVRAACSTFSKNARRVEGDQRRACFKPSGPSPTLIWAARPFLLRGRRWISLPRRSAVGQRVS
jgi:site-specific DNA-cytosine methylase